MNTLNISNSESKVFAGFDAMVIRLGLLISDVVFSAGDLHTGIMIDTDLEAKENKSTKRKLELLNAFIETNDENIGINKEDVETVNYSLKILNAIKYKSPQEIKTLKNIENYINETFKIMNLHYLQTFERAGMVQLKRFVQKGLEFNSVDIQNPESTELDKEVYLNMSDILLDRFLPETSDEIYLVTGDFMKYLVENNFELGELGGEKNKKAKILCALNALMFPHIIHLTENEMELVREHILSSNLSFRTHIEDWNKELVTVPFEKRNFDSFNARYKKEIEPELELMQLEIDKNERLQLIKMRTQNVIEFQVSLFVTSIGLYWDYLASTGAITDDTITVLKKHPRYAIIQNTTCILMEGNVFNKTEPTDYDTTYTDEEKPELTKRKTLDL